jgi:hypothetical protein
MDGVSVFVQDHFGVFSIVHTALAETQFVLVLGGERVVGAQLVQAHVLRPHVDRAPRRAETEALDVFLRFGDPVVGHYLLEAVVVAAIAELVRR